MSTSKALNEHERREVRAGLWLRRQELERLQKTVARSGLAAATRELESRLELVDALLRATATEEELAELDGRDPRQLEIPAAGEPQPVDAEALEQEIERALRDSSPVALVCAKPRSDVGLADELWHEWRLALDDDFADAEDEFRGRVLEPGEFVHSTEAGEEVLCRLSVVDPDNVDGEPVLRFEYDAVPPGELPHGRTVVFQGAALLELVRRAWDIPRPECPHEHIEMEPGRPARCVDCGAEVPAEEEVANA